MKYNFIESERLVLRPPLQSDLQAVSSSLEVSSQDISHWLPKEDIPVASTQWIDEQLGKALQQRSFYFLGFIKGSSVAEIACATILSVRNAKLPSYSVAYWTATEYYNRGYATEALVAVTAFAFSILSAKRVSTGHAITNTASQRVIEKAGFNRESIVALGYQMPKSEEFLDGVVYSLISASGLRNANHEFGQIEIDSLLLKGIEDSRCKFT